MKVISWADIEIYINSVIEKYKNSGVTGVYGIPRGGLILAVMISHALNIPMLSAPTKDCLIVDDICDTGESLIHYDRNSSSMDKPKYHITTLMYRKGAMVTPELYWGTKDNEWIVFPWEVKSCIE